MTALEILEKLVYDNAVTDAEKRVVKTPTTKMLTATLQSLHASIKAGLPKEKDPLEPDMFWEDTSGYDAAEGFNAALDEVSHFLDDFFGGTK